MPPGRMLGCSSKSSPPFEQAHRESMARTARAIALMLMLLTGVVLGQLYRLDSPGAATIPAANPLALQTAERFYAAVNSLLETGDPSALRGTLHDRFVDRASDHESPASAGELEDQLLALRQSLPGIRVA